MNSSPTKKKIKTGPTKVSTFMMPEVHRRCRSQAALKGLTLAEWLYEAAIATLKQSEK
tara:strand:+ start:562 stop:735 length:174 start_codon:yes stop_codon:yes gene_type:complete